MTIEELIAELKPLVQYNKQEQRHYMGSTILTNQEVNHILKVMLGKEYTNLSANERTRMRQRIFKECI